MKYEWERFFPQVILTRGKEYYRSGAVENLRITDESVFADVEGTETYEVEICFDKNKIDYMECTCPYAEENEYCKHMAAVMFAYEEAKSTKQIAPEKSEMSLEEIVRKLPEETARELLIEYAKKHSDLYDRIILFTKGDITPLQKASWEREIMQIYKSYCHNGYINYYDSYDYFMDFADFLGERLGALIKHNYLEEAFELCVEVYSVAFDAEWDDSDGGSGLFISAFADSLKEIIYLADFPLREKIYRRLLAECGGRPFACGEHNWIYDFLLDEFDDKELLDNNLSLLEKEICNIMLSGESGYWLVHLIEKQAETMQRLGYDEKDITEFRAKHRHLKHFRLEEIKEAIQKEENETAIGLILESRRLDAEDASAMCLYSQWLISLYREEKMAAEYEAELKKYIFEHKQNDIAYILELKETVSEEEWRELFEKILALPYCTGEVRYNMLVNEKLYRRLMDELLAEGYIYWFERYENILKTHFSEETRDIFFRYVRRRMDGASTRNEYAEIAKRLRKLCNYPGGEEMAKETVFEWRVKYKRRSAMLDELKRAGF